jgi:hypothetical protein
MNQKSGWRTGSKGGVTQWTYKSPGGESYTNRAIVREWLLGAGHPLFCEPVDGLTLADIGGPLPEGAAPEEPYIRAVKEHINGMATK